MALLAVTASYGRGCGGYNRVVRINSISYRIRSAASLALAGRSEPAPLRAACVRTPNGCLAGRCSRLPVRRVCVASFRWGGDSDAWLSVAAFAAEQVRPRFSAGFVQPIIFLRPTFQCAGFVAVRAVPDPLFGHLPKELPTLTHALVCR